MSKLDEILNEYRDYMEIHRLAPKNQIPFFILRIRQFLYFARHHRLKSFEEVYELFGKALGTNPHINDWQLRQALDAVRIYGYQFRGISSLSSRDSLDSSALPLNLESILTRLREIMRLRHYSYHTEKIYLHWAKRFFYYCEQIGLKGLITEKEIKAFLTHLALKQRVSASTQNQAFNALLLLCREILKVDLTEMQKSVRAKRGRRLPVVLSVSEVERLLAEIKDSRLLMVELLYGSGLRVSELVRLRIKDIDFDNGIIMVKSGKGDKDRATILPQSLRERIRTHLKAVKETHDTDITAGNGEVYLPEALERKYPNAASEWHWTWVFPAEKLSIDPQSSKIRRHHVSPKYIQRAVKNAVKRAGISKHVSVHTLRHSFATHLLLTGTDLREIQELLGHKSVETTMIYTHVVQDLRAPSVSPLDKLRDNAITENG